MNLHGIVASLPISDDQVATWTPAVIINTSEVESSINGEDNRTEEVDLPLVVVEGLESDHLIGVVWWIGVLFISDGDLLIDLLSVSPFSLDLDRTLGSDNPVQLGHGGHRVSVTLEEVKHPVIYLTSIRTVGRCCLAAARALQHTSKLLTQRV